MALLFSLGFGGRWAGEGREQGSDMDRRVPGFGSGVTAPAVMQIGWFRLVLKSCLSTK